MSTTAKLSVKKGASTASDPILAARELHSALFQQDISLVVFFCSPRYPLDPLATELARLFGETEIVGCTTAGEISPIGYLEGSITGVSIASADFRAATARIDNIGQFDVTDAERVATLVNAKLAGHDGAALPEQRFGFLLIDGLCTQEELVTSALYRALGGIDLFGGSAGDGVDFVSTYVYHAGAFHSNAAVITVVATSLPFMVFKTQHFVGSNSKMVVTEADPVRRIVSEINGEPAGREYARVVGLDVDKLTPMIFASHPVVVKLGGEVYVRSIQKLNDDGSLSFFCAIDEGIVLTLAQGVDIVENLQGAFASVRERMGTPELVLGCDCILRNLELQQRALREKVGDIFRENNVIGFATYGEQFNAMHVNQTFTGVAIGTSKGERERA
ncbi:MAG: nitric oxide-sensing protein NosP [Polyangiaceae bacterium]|nr:nitric oxide-sensing protein NosP [Polyangiaceae bacterium]